MSIRTQTPPNVTSYPKVDIFKRDDFNEALWENGYDVMLEEAIACPCKGTSSDAKSNCSNCLGTGWIFINPIKTKAFISSINRNTKYKEWSPELIGTIAVTFMNVNRFGFMDKVTLMKHYGMMSETLTARTNTTAGTAYQMFSFATYGIKEIRSVFVYDGEDSPLIKIPSNEYRINPNNSNVIDIKSTSFTEEFNGKISVSYKHLVTYNILDIPHDLRITKEYSNSGKRETQEMPVQAIARKAQYEMGKVTNYAGNNLQNNSYL
jgi:hypothetical protein